MFLKKFIYVNWGNIPQLEFEFGPVNLLSGGNGSGKTTAADAIQTVMRMNLPNAVEVKKYEPSPPMYSAAMTAAMLASTPQMVT